jgi:hypothetical protein
MRSIENARQIPIYVRLKTRKGTELVQQLGRNYKDFFVFGHGNGTGLLGFEQDEGGLGWKSGFPLLNYLRYDTRFASRWPFLFPHYLINSLPRMSPHFSSLSSRFVILLAVSCNICQLHADEPALTAAVQMFPADTQAMVVLPNAERFLETWNRTQLGQLAGDNNLKNFWNTQQAEIQGRFQEAGWQLSFQFEDLANITGGQTALAWIARPAVPAKPYSVAMVVDVAGRIAPAEKFLKRVEEQLKLKGATAKSIEVNGMQVAQYFTPQAAGELRARESFYVLSKDQLLAGDDVATVKELLDAQTGKKSNSIGNQPLYQTVQTKIKSEGEEPEIEYFVRPIGFAKLLRSISTKPSNNQADVLKILEGQGFDQLQCFSGNIQIANDSFDFFHNGYLIANKPLPASVQILDFPNVDRLVPPSWINKESASVLSFAWNAKEAFAKFEGLVDAYVGQGTFVGVMDGIRSDPNGPQIDIAKDVLPFITNEFHVVTEVKQPIAPDSKRSMVIVKLNDPNKKLAKTLDRFGKSEPDATPIDIEGYRVWKFKNTESDQERNLDLNFDSSSNDKKAEEAEADAPLLDQWAISIMDDYFLFASDADMILDTIKNAKANQGTFSLEKDVVLVTDMLQTVAGNDSHSFRQLTRADRSFEMQYELFRQGILPESKSMMASIMDKILKPKNRQNQQINGGALPPFGAVKQYFLPSGGVIRTEEDGWSLQSFILSKQP